jgi:hypothetical protein
MTFIHYLNPMPEEIMDTFESPEKIILISFNESVKMKQISGSKLMKNNILSYLIKLFDEPSMLEFILNFLKAYVIKPSITVIKRLV